MWSIKIVSMHHIFDRDLACKDGTVTVPTYFPGVDMDSQKGGDDED